MIKKLIFTTYYLIITAYCIAQSNTFSKTYNLDSLNDVGFSVIETLDGGYIAVGDSHEQPPYASGLFTVKVDKKGNLMWNKFIDPSPGPYGDDAYSVIQLKDSSYIVCGDTKDSFFKARPKILLLKLDKKGNSEWLKTYVDTLDRLNDTTDILNDYGDAVLQTQDGGFLILGTTWDSLGTGIKLNAILIKTDSLGNMEWLKHYGDIGNDVPKSGSLIKTQDGGYAFTGYTTSITGEARVWLFKLDNKADSLWQSTFAIGNDDGANDIAQTLDGGFILVGFAEQPTTPGEYDGYIVKTDNNGVLDWEKRFTYGDGSGIDNTFIGVTQLADSTYVVAGNPCYPSSPRCEGILINLKPNGDEVWTRYYSRFGGDRQDYVYDMSPTSDGGFILCGVVMDTGALQQDMWLVKTDCMGNADVWDSVGCYPFITSVPEIISENKMEVVIYPNPFSTTATIKITNNRTIEQANYELKIYDVLGREVHQQTLNAKLETLNLQLPNGIYFYQITTADKKIARGKIVKQ